MPHIFFQRLEQRKSTQSLAASFQFTGWTANPDTTIFSIFAQPSTGGGIQQYPGGWENMIWPPQSGWWRIFPIFARPTKPTTIYPVFAKPTIYSIFPRPTKPTTIYPVFAKPTIYSIFPQPTKPTTIYPVFAKPTIYSIFPQPTEQTIYPVFAQPTIYCIFAWPGPWGSFIQRGWGGFTQSNWGPLW